MLKKRLEEIEKMDPKKLQKVSDDFDKEIKKLDTEFKSNIKIDNKVIKNTEYTRK
jgi:hypothetical protein